MLSNGYVKLYRKILEHPIFTQLPPTVLKVWIVCLVRANLEPTKWYDGHQQIDIPAGAFIFSQDTLAKDCHLSRHQIRTALQHLQNLHCVAIKSTNKYSLLVVEKWTIYQLAGPARGQQYGQQAAIGGPTSGQQAATEEEVKKLRREEKDSALVLSWEWEPAFNEWWAVWSPVRGTQRYLKASEAYALSVNPATRQEALECTASYLASLDRPNQGFYPDTFLRQQAEDGFKARFPVRKPKTLEDRLRDTAANNLLKFGRI